MDFRTRRVKIVSRWLVPPGRECRRWSIALLITLATALGLALTLGWVTYVVEEREARRSHPGEEARHGRLSLWSVGGEHPSKFYGHFKLKTLAAEKDRRRTSWNCYSSNQYERRANGECVSTRKTCNTPRDMEAPGEEIRVRNFCADANSTKCLRVATVVVLTSGKGPENALLDVVENYRRMPLVDQVLIIWNNQEKAAPTSLNETIPHMAPVVVLPQSENVLLNRYSNYARVRTDAVFLTDDDITLCAESLEMSYVALQRDPERLVSLTLRKVGQMDKRQPLSYMRAGRIQGTHGVAYFMPSKYLRLFLERAPAPVLEFIRTQRPTCEDLALIFMVSNMTGKPPLLLDHHMFDWPTRNGCCYRRLYDNRHSMSQTMGIGTWNEKRKGCITTWQRMFQHTPDMETCEMIQQCRSPPRKTSDPSERVLFLGDGN